MPTSKSNNKVIGITLGDPGGIGPEVVTKALSSPKVRSWARYIVITDEGMCPLPKSESISPYLVDTNIDKQLALGKISKANGYSSLLYLQTATELLKDGRIDALVTAPVSKEAIMLSDRRFIGHTEYLADAFNIPEVGMMFVSDMLRTIIVTRHIPIQAVSRALTVDNIVTTLQLTHTALKNNFGISKPRIAVCGLNPHAGENGKIGKEDLKIIKPALQKARRKRIQAMGPFAADTLFVPDKLSAYDCVVAMYHDQGLIPIKSLAFDTVVNLTVGLPFIRTSPAHGTAFDIAGQNIADPTSMVEAIRLASQLA